tara:strand:- start:1434 stop:2846 length:1413 start_codon:yes stop_codon:yes gene_type:complete
MSKAILIFINIIGFLIYTILNINDVSITHTAPKEIPIGQEVEVNLIINKNDFSGPGRLRLNLTQAEGIIVKENMSDGSSFTFKENEVLFIWYDLPSEKNIVITYTIIAEENISGMKKISGDFSFINENERKQLELPDLIFKVNPELIADQTVKENNSTTSSVRSIEKLEEDYIITVKTSIDNHKGFARIKEELPTNFTAEAIETAGSVFKNTDGYAKFIWANLPDSNSEIIIIYKISNNKGLDTNFTISGVYSSEKLISEGYNSGIEIPQTKYIPFKEISENLEIDSVTINTNIEDEIKIDTSLELANTNKINMLEDINTSKYNEEITNEIIPEKVVKTNSVTEKTEVKQVNEVNKKEVIKEEKVLENIISPKRANNNIDYKVQILAGHRIITNKQVYNQFNYQGEYSLETHNGWIKYTVGTNSEYIKARDSRNELNNFNFPGPFVTAYNYGERISVQEALILTSQNWVP